MFNIFLTLHNLCLQFQPKVKSVLYESKNITLDPVVLEIGQVEKLISDINSQVGGLAVVRG